MQPLNPVLSKPLSLNGGKHATPNDIMTGSLTIKEITTVIASMVDKSSAKMISLSEMRAMMPTVPRSSLAAVISALVCKQHKFKRSTDAEKELYLRTKNLPTPDGHIELGYKSISHHAKGYSVRAKQPRRSKTATSTVTEETPVPSTSQFEMSMNLRVGDTTVNLSMTDAKALYKNLHDHFGK